jgi:hypothetical protein
MERDELARIIESQKDVEFPENYGAVLGRGLSVPNGSAGRATLFLLYTQ